MSFLLISIIFPLVFEIIHTPPKQIYSNNPVNIHITTSEEIITAHLLVEESVINVKKDKQNLLFTIPSEFINPPYVRYSIMVKTRNNKTIRSPEYKITVIEKEEVVELITPEPYESINNKKPEIVLCFTNEVTDISTCSMFLDGINITQRCEITPYSIYYKPEQNLKMGKHTLETIIKDISTTHTFSVVSDKYIHGHINTGLQYATYNGSIDTDYLPYSPGFHLPFDIYTSGVFYLPFSFWLYYEETTNFNLEIEAPILKVSLGDIYPMGSLLTLYMASPRGIQLNTTSLPFDVELLAGETEHKDTTISIDTFIDTFIMVDTIFVDTLNTIIDTIFVDTLIDTLVDTTFSGNYTQYLFGGSVRWKLWNTKLGISCFYGYDDSSSLEIESHFLESSLIESPIRNYLIAGNFEYPLLKNLSIGAEYSTSKTHNIPSYIFQENIPEDTIGIAYNIFVELENKLIDTKLTYNNIGKSYYTMGNPYLEAGKKEFISELSSSYKSMYYNGTYEVYQVYDTYDTLKYNFYTSLNYTFWKFTPYIIHSMIENSTSFTFGNRFAFNRGAISLSYGFSSSSNSFRGDCSYEIFKNKLNIKGGHGRNESLDSLGINTTLSQTFDFEIELIKLINLEYKGISNKDYSSTEYNYEENIFTIRLKKTF